MYNVPYFIHIYIYIYICYTIYIQIHIHIHIHNTHTHIHIHIHKHVHTDIYIYIYIQIAFGVNTLGRCWPFHSCGFGAHQLCDFFQGEFSVLTFPEAGNIRPKGLDGLGLTHWKTTLKVYLFVCLGVVCRRTFLFVAVVWQALHNWLWEVTGSFGGEFGWFFAHFEGCCEMLSEVATFTTTFCDQNIRLYLNHSSAYKSTFYSIVPPISFRRRFFAGAAGNRRVVRGPGLSTRFHCWSWRICPFKALVWLYATHRKMYSDLSEQNYYVRILDVTRVGAKHMWFPCLSAQQRGWRHFQAVLKHGAVWGLVLHQAVG